MAVACAAGRRPLCNCSGGGKCREGAFLSEGPTIVVCGLRSGIYEVDRLESVGQGLRCAATKSVQLYYTTIAAIGKLGNGAEVSSGYTIFQGKQLHNVSLILRHDSYIC